ncbi:alpha-L-fucosidase [Streptomyces rimosus]|uniref:alpha-L-fucosidase n=1 Tax=Streptomyces rimosus TaxID=1927 RepID=UPI00067C8F1F|nr:alpha-L-fucosidase [Streptomyces rimosus]
MSRRSTDTPPPRRRAWRSATLALVALAVAGGGVVAAGPAAGEERAPRSAAAEGENPIVTINDSDTQAQILEKAAKVTPTARQLAWQREELTGFVHFGPNTFTGKEWGEGTEDPNILQPKELDTDQWARTFKSAGFKKVILTAKHHDGMLLFPSAYSDYGIAKSSWMGGKGDIVKSFTDSARKYGLKVGFYLSPADGHEAQPGGRYGNGSAKKTTTIPSNGGGGPKFTFQADDYNRYYMNTLYELLTKYGKLDELWFDGANPWPDKPQSYNFNDWFKMVRTLQPSAVMFSGPDIRWVGNEHGFTTRASEWSVVPQSGTADVDGERHSKYGEQADNIAGDDKLTTDADYLAWHPAECDGRLQGRDWFWDPNAHPSPLQTLQNMYRNSVGKNCQLLLNVAPDNRGKVPEAAEKRMREFGEWIRSVNSTDHAAGGTASNDTGTANTPGNDPANVLDGKDSTAWQPTGRTGSLVVDLGSKKTFTTVNLQENIQVGQRVSGFAVDVWDGSQWREAGKATTIGYRRLLQLPEPVTTQKVRLRITSSRALPPAIATLGLLDDRSAPNLAQGKPATQSSTLGITSGADRAVDGNTSGEYFAGGSVTHTSLTPIDDNPWWQVDLGSSQRVGKVKLWNRTDCCSDRLRKFYVFASDKPFTSNDPKELAKQDGLWSHYQEAAVATSPNGSTSLSLNVDRDARYLRVQLVGSDRPLSLAEFQAFR